MPEFHETERKLRVVYMERGADRYGAFKRVVQETLEQIATLDFVNFIVIHTVKGFGIVNKAKIDVFLELSCFFDDLADVGNLISVTM